MLHLRDLTEHFFTLIKVYLAGGFGLYEILGLNYLIVYPHFPAS
jgi:hypothetical protein